MRGNLIFNFSQCPLFSRLDQFDIEILNFPTHLRLKLRNGGKIELSIFNYCVSRDWVESLAGFSVELFLIYSRAKQTSSPSTLVWWLEPKIPDLCLLAFYVIFRQKNEANSVCWKEILQAQNKNKFLIAFYDVLRPWLESNVAYSHSSRKPWKSIISSRACVCVRHKK